MYKPVAAAAAVAGAARRSKCAGCIYTSRKDLLSEGPAGATADVVSHASPGNDHAALIARASMIPPPPRHVVPVGAPA